MTKQNPTWGGVFTILEVSEKLHEKAQCVLNRRQGGAHSSGGPPAAFVQLGSELH